MNWRGAEIQGIVTNLTNFGAFVDVGVHQDGLIHISHLSDNFVKDPYRVITVLQKVKVTVIEVDVPRKRIALSMKSDPFAEGGSKHKEKDSSKVSNTSEQEIKPIAKPKRRKRAWARN